MDFFRLVLPAERALTSARPYRGNMTRVQSFPPIVSERSKLLILGSMPGELSLKVGQYYAHPRNAFWPIMGELFGAGPSLSYQERVAILQSVGVALWDALQACIRPGSLDASIMEEVANDFPALFAEYPNIKHVFFNGGMAEKAFRRHVLPALPEDHHIFARLPSTSPAHAAMRLEEKVQAWRVLKKGLS
jgi:hypoxanthine-DNA glycosylase